MSKFTAQKTFLLFGLMGTLLTGCHPFAKKYGKGRIALDDMFLNTVDGTRDPIKYTTSSTTDMSLLYIKEAKHKSLKIELRDRDLDRKINPTGEIIGLEYRVHNPQTNIDSVTTYDGICSSESVISTVNGDTLYTKRVWGGLDTDRNRKILKQFIKTRSPLDKTVRHVKRQPQA